MGNLDEYLGKSDDTRARKHQENTASMARLLMVEGYGMAGTRETPTRRIAHLERENADLRELTADLLRLVASCDATDGKLADEIRRLTMRAADMGIRPSGTDADRACHAIRNA